tara:strand:+ start:2775 stop:3275 length:501 start_codon:yes stop_codon:yes gene_type:complete
MIQNIFNPKFCLSTQVRESWCAGVLDSDRGKIPIEVVQGIPRLKLDQDPNAKEDWFCAVLPLDPVWGSIDLETFKFLNFNFYTDYGLYCRVGLKDASENSSLELELYGEENCREGDESRLSLDLSRFLDDPPSDFNPKESRLLKFIGYNDTAFYISEVTLSSAPST